MTALLKIKGRQDPLRISDADAKALKTLWLDVEGTPRNKLIDLGEWAGELRDVKSIDIEENREASGGAQKLEDEEKQVAEARDAFLALPHDKKLLARYEEVIGGYKLRYKLQNKQEPSEELVKQAEFKALGYFAANPARYDFPMDIFADLLRA